MVTGLVLLVGGRGAAGGLLFCSVLEPSIFSQWLEPTAAELLWLLLGAKLTFASPESLHGYFHLFLRQWRLTQHIVLISVCLDLGPCSPVCLCVHWSGPLPIIRQSGGEV